jgi:hypothetical protein
MEKTFSKAEDLAQNLKEYAANRIDQAKLSTAEKTAAVMSYLLAAGVVVLLLVFFILFGAIALSLFMGEVFGAMYWGFLFTGGILLLLAIFTWIFRAGILQYPIMNALIKQLFTKNEEENEDEED